MAEKFGDNADMEVNELLVSDVERVIIRGGRGNGVEEAHAEDRLEAERVCEDGDGDFVGHGDDGEGVEADEANEVGRGQAEGEGEGGTGEEGN